MNVLEEKIKKVRETNKQLIEKVQRISVKDLSYPDLLADMIATSMSGILVLMDLQCEIGTRILEIESAVMGSK